MKIVKLTFWILNVIIFVVGGYVLLKIMSYRDGHGGVYNEVRQCSNVKAYMTFLEQYKNNTGVYPNKLPKFDAATLSVTIDDIEYYLSLYKMYNTVLTQYDYRRNGDMFDFTFTVPNGKQFTVHSPEDVNKLCFSGANIKCLDNDFICRWHYSIKD